MLTKDGILYSETVEKKRFLLWSYDVGIVTIKVNRFDSTQFRPSGSFGEWEKLGKHCKAHRHLRKVTVYYETKQSDGSVTKHKLCKL